MIKDYDDYEINSENEEYLLEGKWGDSVQIEKEKEKQLLQKAKKATCKILSEKNNKKWNCNRVFCIFTFIWFMCSIIKFLIFEFI